MTTNIPSAQLSAITHCELAAIALDKARRALQAPELEFDGAIVLAPSGRKHVEQIRTTLGAINKLLGASSDR